MKKRIWGILSLFLFSIGLSGCHAVGEKTASQSIIYAATAFLSLLLLIGCCLLVHNKRKWFILLFSSVLVVNLGYTFLSVSPCLEIALWANRLSYLGSVFLPFAMLMIILNATNIRYKKWLPYSLLTLAVVVFFIAASPGILEVYYKEVSFTVEDGVSMLVKVYGPLHPIYLIYLLGYFTTMIGVIIRSSIKKAIDTTAHAVILAIAVFVNIGVWFVEQLSSFNFEMLSISYIISELFLLGLHLVMNENQRLRELVKIKEEALQASTADVEPAPPVSILVEETERFRSGLTTLTPTEKIIYEAYLNGTTTKEIMSNLNIKENTLKFHNKNLYSKLGVSSRKRLIEISSTLQDT